MTVNVTNIKWKKTDNDGNPISRKILKKLPKKVGLELDDEIHIDLDGEITDFLMDTYKCELESFTYEYDDYIDYDYFGEYVNSVEANVS